MAEQETLQSSSEDWEKNFYSWHVRRMLSQLLPCEDPRAGSLFPSDIPGKSGTA